MEERIKAILADILMTDASAIEDSLSMETDDRWDSLAHIDLIAALEEEFGVMFEAGEFETMTSYADILEIVSEKI